MSTISAHEAGVTDTSITVINDSVSLVYTVPREHLPEITGDEINAESIKHAIESVQDGFEVTNNKIECKLASAATRNLSQINSRQFAYLHNCSEPIQALQISYQLLFENDPAHKNYTRIAFSGKTENITFKTNRRVVDLDLESNTLLQAKDQLATQPALKRFMAGSYYFPIGVEHILFGPDHLLFLAALLLLPLRFKHLLLLITTFTVAHSITLALSVMDIIVLTPAIVELVIALSIVYVAVESIYLLRRQAQAHPCRYMPGTVVYKRIAVTALFGLIHGFGFSFLLKEIGLDEQLLSSLLFFNLGVEAGQLLAMVIFLPIVVYLFKRYATTLWAQALSLVVGAVGLYWFYERLQALIT